MKDVFVSKLLVLNLVVNRVWWEQSISKQVAAGPSMLSSMTCDDQTKKSRVLFLRWQPLLELHESTRLDQLPWLPIMGNEETRPHITFLKKYWHNWLLWPLAEDPRGALTPPQVMRPQIDYLGPCLIFFHKILVSLCLVCHFFDIWQFFIFQDKKCFQTSLHSAYIP